jgi:hypothetical protein
MKIGLIHGSKVHWWFQYALIDKSARAWRENQQNAENKSGDKFYENLESVVKGQRLNSFSKLKIKTIRMRDVHQR